METAEAVSVQAQPEEQQQGTTAVGGPASTTSQQQQANTSAPPPPPSSSSSWRGRPGEPGSSGAITTSSKGDLQMADQYIRDHFTLFLWIPTEQVGIVIGKKGAKIQYIQVATKTRVVIAQTQPGGGGDDEWESAWFQVMVKGPPSGCYQAFKMISALVDEVDDCVASFPIPRPKHSLVIGKNGTTIRTISADTNVRIYVPGKKEEAATNDIQLEGEVSNVMAAVAHIMTAVYASSSSRTPTAAQQAAAASKPQQAEGKEGSGSAAGAGEGNEGGEAEDGKSVGKGGAQANKTVNNKQQQQAQAGEEEEEALTVERTLVVSLSQLRLLVAGKKNSALTAVAKATGTKIVKEPKAKPATEPPANTSGEAKEGEEEANGHAEAAAEGAVTGKDEEGEEEEASKGSSTVGQEGGEEEEEEEEEEADHQQQEEEDGKPEAEEEEEEEEGEEEEEAAAAQEGGDADAAAAPASTTAEDEEEGAAAAGTEAAAEGEEEAGAAPPAVVEPEIKIFIRGHDSKSVDAAAEALLAVANAKAVVKDLIPELRNRFGKANPAGGQQQQQPPPNNGSSSSSSSNKAGNHPRQHGKGGANKGPGGKGPGGKKVGGGRGGGALGGVPRRGNIQVAPKTTT